MTEHAVTAIHCLMANTSALDAQKVQDVLLMKKIMPKEEFSIIALQVQISSHLSPSQYSWLSWLPNSLFKWTLIGGLKDTTGILFIA